MSTSVKPIPDDYAVITPYLTFQNTAKAIEFYKTVFGAVEVMRLDNGNGGIGHAEIAIGGCKLMLSDECPMAAVTLAPQKLAGSPVAIHLYVENVDAIVAHAAFEGSQILSSPQDHFYGDRGAVLRDPFGHIWYIATRVEEVSPQEMQKRADAFTKKMQKEKAGSAK
jgi:PhnB protein